MIHGRRATIAPKFQVQGLPPSSSLGTVRDARTQLSGLLVQLLRLRIPKPILLRRLAVVIRLAPRTPDRPHPTAVGSD
ncbi:hypothetical protein CHU98_g3742 [Xylaria longipes]|nr:hypothetical protein CHU98_g3742 [Xylaria longipes]